MKCSSCGKEIADDSVFCEFCGVKVGKKQPRLRTYAFLGVLILCIVLAVAIIIVLGRSSQVFDSSGSHSQHDYVDLGLSVMWATCNVGASKPEEYGRYFAWGDVTGQTWNGSWSGSGFSTYLRYKLSNNNLTSAYDAAHVNLSGKWRMPTKAEFEELISNCTWTWTTLNGVRGYNVTSKKPGYEGKSIFLPTAGSGDRSSLSDAGSYGDSYGDYWSSTFGGGAFAWVLRFDSGNVGTYNTNRFYGKSVRPVSEY